MSRFLSSLRWLFPCLGLVVCWGAAWAQEPEDGNDSAAVEKITAEQLANNPDDVKLLTAWMNGLSKTVSELVEPSPAEALKKLADAREVVSSLKPESDEGKAFVSRLKLVITSQQESIELMQIPLADLEKQIDDKPTDTTLLRKYTRKVLGEISSLARTEPDKADSLRQTTLKRLEQLREANEKNFLAKPHLDSLERSLATVEKTIESGRKLAALIGTKAPPLGVETWANGASLTDADLRGKVVLLDFWAVWCGPCIATFPHLREWHDKYSDKGLAIVGMTRFYNYAWNEEAGKAIRGKTKGEVPESDELVMLDKFAKQHRLKHPFAIQTGEHSVAEKLGVSGIPHVVLIDRQGTVRLIRVGSGPKNAKAISAMIEKLLEEPATAAK